MTKCTNFYRDKNLDFNSLPQFLIINFNFSLMPHSTKEKYSVPTYSSIETYLMAACWLKYAVLTPYNKCMQCRKNTQGHLNMKMLPSMRTYFACHLPCNAAAKEALTSTEFESSPRKAAVPALLSPSLV
jgi:hypothetical protein